MTIENISWSISMTECCRPWRGSSPQPPGLQLDTHRTEPPRPTWFLGLACGICPSKVSLFLLLLLLHLKFLPNYGKKTRKSFETLLQLTFSGTEVMKLFSFSTQLSMKFVQLINLKLLTNANSFLLNIAEHENFLTTKAGIFIFISRENFMLCCVEHEKKNCTLRGSVTIFV